MTGHSLRPALTLDDLTWRQRQIGGMVARGWTNREAAAAIGIKESTAKNHIEVLMIRTGTRNRVELARWYWEREREVQT